MQRNVRRDARSGDRALSLGRQGNRARNAEVLPHSFITTKENRFIGFNWSTNTAAKLITLERWYIARIEKVTRIEGTVTEKFEHRPVELICARLSNGIDDRPST